MDIMVLCLNGLLEIYCFRSIFYFKPICFYVLKALSKKFHFFFVFLFSDLSDVKNKF